MSARVINRNNFQHSPEAVYIGRGSKWGNPFRIGEDGNRAEVIEKYETYLKLHPELIAALHELRGMNLMCHCAPKPCHGDVLLRLANPAMSPLAKRMLGAF